MQEFWGVHPEVLIHVGAHKAEELRDYADLGWGSKETIWIEALPSKVKIVESLVSGLPNHRVIKAVAWDKAGEEIEFNETNNGQSSSALKLKDHSTLYPDIVVTRVTKMTTSTMDKLVDFDKLGEVNLVNLDVQGAELRVLKGFGQHLGKVDAIYSEVNTRELYEGCARLDEMDSWLFTQGFKRVDWVLVPGMGWGDALWLRRTKVPANSTARRTRRKILDSPRMIKPVISAALRFMWPRSYARFRGGPAADRRSD